METTAVKKPKLNTASAFLVVVLYLVASIIVALNATLLKRARLSEIGN